jgi:hypothetical protein
VVIATSGVIMVVVTVRGVRRIVDHVTLPGKVEPKI